MGFGSFSNELFVAEAARAANAVIDSAPALSSVALTASAIMENAGDTTRMPEQFAWYACKDASGLVVSADIVLQRQRQIRRDPQVRRDIILMSREELLILADLSDDVRAKFLRNPLRQYTDSPYIDDLTYNDGVIAFSSSVEAELRAGIKEGRGCPARGKILNSFFDRYVEKVYTGCIGSR